MIDRNAAGFAHQRGKGFPAGQGVLLRRCQSAHDRIAGVEYEVRRILLRVDAPNDLRHTHAGATSRFNMDLGHMSHAQRTRAPRRKSRREIGLFIVCLASGGMP
jgi:hypothetical protein